MTCNGISGNLPLQNIQGNQNVKGSGNPLTTNAALEPIRLVEHQPQDAIMNQDGSITVITKWNDGTNACSREVTFVYDKNNNKVIKSVKTSSAELYGAKSTTKELIDKDGDGYADEAVIKEIDGGKVTESKVKYPKVDENTDKHELAHQGRNMSMQARGLVCY